MIRAYTKPVEKLSSADFVNLVEIAWKEDCCDQDITSSSIFDNFISAEAKIVSKEEGILCGSNIISAFSYLVNNDFSFKKVKKDGDFFTENEELLLLRGRLVDILKLERSLLNFLQYLSGIATQTYNLVKKYKPYGIKIFDTRKTLPAYRKLSKYAVYCGGGNNHRLNLEDMAMIKDNHLTSGKDIISLVEKIKMSYPNKLVEVEVDSFDQINKVIQSKADIILLDNFDIETTKQAIIEIRKKKPSLLIECSGNITPKKLELFKQFSPIAVSMGYLTHTNRFLDLSMEISIKNEDFSTQC